MYTNTEIDNLLANADIATYKCASKRAKDKVRKNVDIFRNVRLIYMVKNSLYWAKDFYIGTPSLDAVANYLYTLVQPFIGLSIAALGRVLSSGGNQYITFAPRRIQVKVGAPDSLIADGAQSLVLNYANVLPDSVSVQVVSGGELPIGDVDRFGVSSIDYGTNSTTINFNQTLALDQEFIIRFMCGLVADQSSGGGSSSSLPTQTGHEGESLMTDGTNSFWGDSVISVTSANFEADGVTCNLPAIANNSFIIFWNDVPTMLVEGTDFTRLESGGFVITRAGFDASANSYNLFIFLKGLNDA